MLWEVQIPLRDAVTLSGTLYRPRNASPSPVILVLTPYIRQVHHEQGVYFAGHGYPFMTVDVRGRGGSGGTFKANGNEARDGYDVIEWLAQQPYCNGKVGMWGGSYMGYVQWAAAREAPPHLCAIAPVASPFRGVDSPMRNNIFASYRVQWLTLLGGRTAQERIFADQAFWSSLFKRWFQAGLPFRQLDGLVGHPSPVFQEWLSHPRQDAYWDSYNPSPDQYARIDMPILTITGMYDGNQLGALMHYREHVRCSSPAARARHYLVIGPWDHAGTRVPKAEFAGLKTGPASLVDVPRLHLEWYAWAMEGGPKPSFLRKNVAYYVMGAERWRYADTLDAVTKQMNALYLHSMCNPTDVFASGRLSEDQCDNREPDYYIYDPRDVSLADLESTIDPESRVDQRMTYAGHGKHLVYHSAPFEREIELSGFFKLSLWLSIDQRDTDIKAAIYEIGLDGSAIELTTDYLRVRYREGLRQEKCVESPTPLRCELDRFTFVSRRLGRGHRLRLVIGPVNSIYWEKNYNSGGVVAEESVRDAVAVTVKLYHEPGRPSALYVPIGHDSNSEEI